MADDALVRGDDGVARCWWGASTPDYVTYHDQEWGRPVTDDTVLFEKLCLEGFQSGLSWLTILRKRDNFRAAFAGFDVDAIAAFDESDVERLLGDAGIVRHRGKIEATIANARGTQAIRDEVGSLAALVWSYEPEAGPPPRRLGDLPPSTDASKALAKHLKAHGFRFVGPTTAYAFMQAMGLVNDHLDGCAAREPRESERAALRRPGAT